MAQEKRAHFIRNFILSGLWPSFRHAMVEDPIKLRGVRDISVLHALLQVPLFVEPEFLSQAYSALPIKENQTSYKKQNIAGVIFVPMTGEIRQ
jgi:hypothetical protein